MLRETYVNDPGLLTHVAPFWHPCEVPDKTWHSLTSVAHIGP